MTRSSLAFAIAGIVALCSITLAAHDRKTAGPLTIVIGWATEPAFSGSFNGVAVTLLDKAGPLAQADGNLSVEIAFGTERVTLPLDPVRNRPNEFHAPLMPTRAGTYTFHITGTINNQVIDVSSTCGEGTFHCVIDATAIQFPVKDPSIGQLADRIERSLPRSDAAAASADRARLMAIAALVLSVISIAGAAMAVARASRNRA